jgi:hypothetical protein
MDNKDLSNLILLLVVGFIIWKIIQKVQLAGISNEEEWEIIRNEKTGTLQKIIVHRKVNYGK